MAVLGVDDFKSKLRGGGARPNLFKVTMNFPGYADGDTELTSFLCETAQLPGSTMGTIVIPFRGRQLKMAGDRTFASWTVQIINDTDFDVRNSMERWMNGINAHSANTGLASPIAYEADILVEQLDRDASVIKKYTLRGAFPTELSPIDLAYDAVDQVERFQVTFEYQYFETNTTTQKYIIGKGPGQRLVPLSTKGNSMAEPSRGIRLFGFEIKKAETEDPKKKPSIVPARDDDGAGYVTASGMHYGQYLNIDGDDSKDNYQLIMQYRGVALHPEVDMAIEEIVNESITINNNEMIADINLDKIDISDSIKKQVKEEFDNIYGMLDFNDYGHDIFRRWYVDGRLFHHLVVDEGNLKAGIKEIRPVDASKMRKVKQVKTKNDRETGAKLIEKVDEYFIYQEKPGAANSSGVKLTEDAVSYVTSGLLNEDRKKIVSYLHKALKPINQLRMMEDALVIYRLARAPERRMFYIDVGNLPTGKAEQYMKDIMSRYRNKIVYDAKTGEIRDDRKHQALLEDFWLPRREGGRGTEVSSLPGGQNLGEIDDIVYFQKKMYRALNVPINRLEQEAQFSLGRSSEITRDELKFQKFVDRLRRRFSQLFLNILKKQLILKGIITEEDWNNWKTDIVITYTMDNHFTELKDAEVLREKLQQLDQVQNYVGEYFSKEWVMKNILHFNDEDIDAMQKEISGEGGQEEEPQEESYNYIEYQDEDEPAQLEIEETIDHNLKEKELEVLSSIATVLKS